MTSTKSEYDTTVYTRGYKEHGMMNGYEYAICTYNYTPCCYVVINRKDPFYNALTYDDISLRMHGGCTYFEGGHCFFKLRNIQSYHSSEELKVIGWDFGHCGDWAPYIHGQPMSNSSTIINGKTATVWDRQSLLKEIEEVTLQIRNLRDWKGFYE